MNKSNLLFIYYLYIFSLDDLYFQEIFLIDLLIFSAFNEYLYLLLLLMLPDYLIGISDIIVAYICIKKTASEPLLFVLVLGLLSVLLYYKKPKIPVLSMLYLIISWFMN